MEYREFRADTRLGDEGVIEGLVTPFDSETEIGERDHGGWTEEIARGSFVKTLNEGDPLMIYQHNMAQPLARKSAGNLDLREGSYEGRDGLVINANPVDTSYGRDMRNLVKAKVIRGMSFGFHVVKDDWTLNGQPSDKFHGDKRIVREVKLIEVSPVTRPAYADTAISARGDSYDELLEQRRNAQAGDGETRAPKPYGDVAYADPKNGKYPIDRKHVKAAWAYINQAKNAAKYPLNGVSLASVKAKIRAAMKKFGFTSGSAGRDEYEFVSVEWRDDDPYFDEWYEIDADAEDGDDEETPAVEEPRSQEPDSSTPDDENDEALLVEMLREASSEGSTQLAETIMSRLAAKSAAKVN